MNDQKLVYDIIIGEEGLGKVVQKFTETTNTIIERDSYSLADRKTKAIDISEMFKMIPIQWFANEIVNF